MNYVNYNGTTTSVNDFGKTNFSKEGVYTGPGFEVVKGTSYPGEGRLTHSDMWIYGQNKPVITPKPSSPFTDNSGNDEKTYGVSEPLDENITWLDRVEHYDKSPYDLLNETPNGYSGFYRDLVYPGNYSRINVYYPGIFVPNGGNNSYTASLYYNQNFYHIASNLGYMNSQLLFGWEASGFTDDRYGVKFSDFMNFLYHDRPFQGATFTGGSSNISATTYLNPPVTLQNYDSVSSSGVVSQQMVTKAQNVQYAYFGSYNTNWEISLAQRNQWAANAGTTARWAFNGLYICWSLQKNLSDPKKWLMIPLCSRTDITPNDWNCGINNVLSGNRVYSYIFFNYSNDYFNLAPIPTSSYYGRLYQYDYVNSLFADIENLYVTSTISPSTIKEAGERVKQLFQDTIMNGLTIDYVSGDRYMAGASTDTSRPNALIPFLCWNPFGYFWDMKLPNGLPGQPYRLPGESSFVIDRRQDNGFRANASVPVSYTGQWVPQTK